MDYLTSDGPNWPLWKAIGMGSAVLGSSLALMWAHNRRDQNAKKHKIKDRIVRAMIEDLKGRLELSERLPRIGFRTTALELRAIIEDYIDNHNSQKIYLRPYVTRINSILSSGGGDNVKLQEQLIEVIDDIQEDISK